MGLYQRRVVSKWTANKAIGTYNRKEWNSAKNLNGKGNKVFPELLDKSPAGGHFDFGLVKLEAEKPAEITLYSYPKKLRVKPLIFW